jgi:5-methylcytosine-specific restriction endonuclease McrA
MPKALNLPESDIVQKWLADIDVTSRSLASEHNCSSNAICAILRRHIDRSIITSVMCSKIANSTRNRPDLKTEANKAICRYASSRVSRESRLASIQLAAIASANKRRGVKLSVEIRNAMSVSRIGRNAGDKHPNWKGGTSAVCWRGSGWDSIKRIVRKRDRNTCQLCSRSTNQQGRAMDVHHKESFFSFSDPTEANRLANLVCLCRSCHRKVENGTAVCP